MLMMELGNQQNRTPTNKTMTEEELFSDILINEGYINLYDNVVFGIINDHNSVDNNFEIFNKIFNDKS